MKFRNILYLIILMPIFLILIWLFAIPADFIHKKIEDSIANSGNANINATIKGLRKGLFFTLYTESLDVKINKTPALNIKDIIVSFNPKYLIDKQLALSMKGKIGTGDINGLYKLSDSGEIKIDRAELNAIPYLSHFGIKINGYVTSDINIKNDLVNIAFKVPDLDIQDSALTIVPFINTFRTMQGAISLKENSVKIDSISLEGEKGYARLKGEIKNDFMNLALELMPIEGKLNSLETMLIAKYIVSPGYYVIPIEGMME